MRTTVRLELRNLLKSEKTGKTSFDYLALEPQKFGNVRRWPRIYLEMFRLRAHNRDPFAEL
jgi:hypothetical protein